MNIVILCNGDFPRAAQPLQAMHRADHIVCCDGAYNTLMSQLPDIGIPLTVIGDLDSIADRDAVRCIHVAEQLSNDQTKAFRYVETTWPEAEIVILGATGKREDHTVGNISLLADYLEEHTNSDAGICMMTDYGVFTPINRPTIFKSFPSQQVSLFSMTHGCRITTERLEYPLRQEHLPRWWQGTLNACLAESFAVMPQGGTVIVYQTYEAKL